MKTMYKGRLRTAAQITELDRLYRLAMAEFARSKRKRAYLPRTKGGR
jgi:hypothetical protein